MVMLDDDKAKKILLDKTDYKLIIAKKFLQKIKSNVPLDFDKEHFELEYFSESFVLFAGSVIEILKQEINDKFNCYPRKEYKGYIIPVEEGLREKHFSEFTLRSLITKLKNRGEQKQVKDVLLKYFSKPRKTRGQWDFSNSKLWQLWELRSHIAHERAFSRRAVRVVGVQGGDKTSYLFRFRINKPRTTRTGISKPGYIVAIVNDNPQEFFQDLFDSLIQCRDDIRIIIPEKYPSSYYKNPPDFGIEF